MHKLKESDFERKCIICHRIEGACVKCGHDDCRIYMHAECARRAGYYLDPDRNISSQEDIQDMDSESVSKRFKRLCQSQNEHKRVFCEPHRPFTLIDQIEEKRAEY